MDLRDRILSKKDLELKTIDVPEWGGKVKIRQPSVKDTMRILDAKNTGDQMFCLVVACVVDDEGKRVLKESDKENLLAKDFNFLPTPPMSRLELWLDISYRY